MGKTLCLVVEAIRLRALGFSVIFLVGREGGAVWGFVGLNSVGKRTTDSDYDCMLCHVVCVRVNESCISKIILLCHGVLTSD